LNSVSRDVDYVALSFVRHPEDIRQLREIIEKKKKGVKIIAKIEKVEALENLEEIVALSDGILWWLEEIWLLRLVRAFYLVNKRKLSNFVML